MDDPNIDAGGTQPTRISTPVGLNRPGYRRRWDSADADIDAGGSQPML